MRLALAIFVAASLPAATVLRIACGGPGGMDPSGNTWQADASFSGGFTWSNPGQPVPYSNLRFATSFSYTLQLAPGAYNVTLKFLEPNKTGPGQRRFSVTANGLTVVSNLDLFAETGLLKPVDRTFPVTVTGNTLQLQLAGSQGNAVVSGIQVDALAAPIGISVLSGLIGERPANCPTTGLVFFVATDRQELSWCSAPGTWIGVAHPPAADQFFGTLNGPTCGPLDAVFRRVGGINWRNPDGTLMQNPDGTARVDFARFVSEPVGNCLRK
jgi:Malectin domain